MKEAKKTRATKKTIEGPTKDNADAVTKDLARTPLPPSALSRLSSPAQASPKPAASCSGPPRPPPPRYEESVVIYLAYQQGGEEGFN
jgi:hypothetical protein